MPEYEGQRFRAVRNPGTGTLRYEPTPEYAAWVTAHLARAAEDERTVDRWLLGGMVGRLVRRGGVLEVDTSDPQHVGEIVIIEEGE